MLGRHHALFEATSAVVRVADVPILYFPYLEGDPNDPTGPLNAVVYRQDKIFGSQFYVTWDVLELIGVKRLPGEHWTLMTDFLTNRGPALGTTYDRFGETMFGEIAPFHFLFKAYGIYDHGRDTLAGLRDIDFQPTDMRGRILLRHQQEYENWTFQFQVAYLSDRNFLEQYYNYEFNMGPNQETALYVKHQEGIGAVTALIEPNLDRNFVTENPVVAQGRGLLAGSIVVMGCFEL